MSKKAKYAIYKDILYQQTLKFYMDAGYSENELSHAKMNSEVWKIANNRLDELMHIENQRKLTPSEAIEFQGLQRIAHLVIRWFIHCMMCTGKLKDNANIDKKLCYGNQDLTGYQFDI